MAPSTKCDDCMWEEDKVSGASTLAGLRFTSLLASFTIDTAPVAPLASCSICVAVHRAAAIRQQRQQQQQQSKSRILSKGGRRGWIDSVTHWIACHASHVSFTGEGKPGLFVPGTCPKR
ncbi:unnamed protein product [Onchocerca flexuosa]|uniref:Uncharacterized protein n=1 Tax=Onchocerca flexuosa TaxID=387005 RepID=A0A183HIE7_9BILA|nr:unnamed protein product [Onchocerca flexuosa]